MKNERKKLYNYLAIHSYTTYAMEGRLKEGLQLPIVVTTEEKSNCI